MSNRSITAIFLLVLHISSCSKSHYRTITERYVETNIVSTPQIAETTIGNKIELSLEFNGSDITAAKNKTIVELCSKEGCDFIVEPVFDIHSVGTKLNVKGTGYCGKYTKFRKMELADSNLLKMNQAIALQSIHKPIEKTDKVNDTKSVAGAVVATILGLAVIVPIMYYLLKR